MGYKRVHTRPYGEDVPKRCLLPDIEDDRTTFRSIRCDDRELLGLLQDRCRWCNWDTDGRVLARILEGQKRAGEGIDEKRTDWIGRPKFDANEVDTGEGQVPTPCTMRPCDLLSKAAKQICEGNRRKPHLQLYSY